MVETRIRELKVACKTCNTVLIKIKNALIPIHWGLNNLRCDECDTEINRENVIIWLFDPEEQKHDYFHKEDLI